ncbi:DoxX family membrane protein [Streptomyces spiramenti]|uniref:DoxX family membrane protein n=1 Tax=Streptomyces spiramenti TaxID=2720606 RepID=A0ABX1AEM8_9ACTN|nr:DoxX family membrane protein [Streptomyces spiramenti]NJP65662.1 DoxX family membrane protein [Streptomyces spiramenti]
MSVQPAPAPTSSAPRERRREGTAVPEPHTTPARVLAVLRIATGLLFLWAFLDKTLGLGYATPTESAWVNGGAPAAGYLGGVSAGPLQSTFNGWAGAVWVDFAYMAGMLGLGVALVAGIGLRLAAAGGTVMMLMLWTAEWPVARVLADGSPTMSPNPVVDAHVVYALVMVAMAVCAAGRTWGLGRAWERAPLVRHHAWLR